MSKFDLIPNSACEEDRIRPQAATAFQEAKTRINRSESLDQKLSVLRQKAQDKMRIFWAKSQPGGSVKECGDLAYNGASSPYPETDGTFDEHIVMKMGGKTYSMTHNLLDGPSSELELGEPVEVIPTYEPVKKSKVKERWLQERWSDAARAAAAAGRRGRGKGLGRRKQMAHAAFNKSVSTSPHATLKAKDMFDSSYQKTKWGTMRSTASQKTMGHARKRVAAKGRQSDRMHKIMKNMFR